jgi:hypothetical protein
MKPTNCLPFLLAPVMAVASTPVVTRPSEALIQRVEAKNRDAVKAFYAKTVDVQGLPVLAAACVSDEALLRTHEIVSHVLAGRPDIIKSMATFGTRLLVIGKDQLYTELPEYRDTPDPAFWNERVRGTGGDDVTSFGEENLLNLPGDRYDDMSVGVHEFAHTIDATVSRMEPDWQGKLQACFKAARKRGLFEGTYAGSNATEYWAEGVTMYFDCERPNNWNHGPIITREGLKRYDPGLYALVKDTLRIPPGQDWKLKALRPQPSIAAPPASLKLDPAYTKWTLAREFTVLGTSKVSDEALFKANDTVRKLFAYRHDILKLLMAKGARLVVLGKGERLGELPEFRAKSQVPGFEELRYQEYSDALPLIVVPEENVLGLPGDPFQGENQIVALFAKALYVAGGHRAVDAVFESKKFERQQYELNVRRLDIRFDQDLRAAFAHAATKGLWRGTPAGTELDAYWAAGVCAYFDAAGDGLPPVGGQPVVRRDTLKGYDPELFQLVASTFAYTTHVDWRYKK